MWIGRREKPGSDRKQDRSTCHGTRIRRSKGRLQHSRTPEASHYPSPVRQAICLLKVSTQKCVIPITYGWLVLPQLVDPRVNTGADVTVEYSETRGPSQLCHRPAAGLGRCPHWAPAKPLEFLWFNWNSLMWNFIWELWVTVSLKTDDIYISSISWWIFSYILRIVYFP